MKGIATKSFPISALIGLLAFVPLAALCFALIVIIQQLQHSVESAERTQHVIELVSLLDRVAHEHAIERGLTAGFIGSGGLQLKSEVIEQRRKSDIAVSRLEAYLDTAKDKLPEGLLASSTQGVLELLRQKSAKRLAIDNLEPYANAFSYYSAVNKAALTGIQTTMLALESVNFAQEVEGLRLMLWLQERAGQARGAMNGVFARGSVTPSLYLQIKEYLDEIAYLQTLLRLRLPEPWLQEFKTIQTDNIWFQLAEIEDYFVNQPELDNIQGPAPQIWFPMATQRIELVKQVADHLSTFLTNESMRQASFYQQILWWTLAGSIVLTLAIVWMAYISIRSVSHRIVSLQEMLEQQHEEENELQVFSEKHGKKTAALKQALHGFKPSSPPSPNPGKSKKHFL